MVSFIKAQNCQVFANFTGENAAPNTGDNFILATEASLSSDLSLEADKTFGQPRISSDFNVSAAPATKLTLNFYPMVGAESATDASNQWAITNLTGDFSTGHRILFSNYDLRSCYLSSLNINISPQEPVKFGATFDIFDLSQVTGQTFTGANVQNSLTTNGSGAYLQSLHALALDVSGSGASLPQSKNEISITFNCNRTPVYGLGGTFPETVILDSVEKQVSINGENIGEFCSFSGSNAVLNLAFSPFVDFITGGENFVAANGTYKLFTTGRITSQNLSADADKGLVGSLSLIQNIF